MVGLRYTLLAISLTLLFSFLPNGSCFFRAVKLSSLPPIFAKPTVYSPQLYYLFIYGKLKRNEENHYWLTNPENGLSKFIGLGQTVKKYPLLVGKYQTPILLDNPGVGHELTGFPLLFNSMGLTELSDIREHPHFIKELYVTVLYLYDNFFVGSFEPTITNERTIIFQKRILGEIYVVDTFMLRNLDMLEGLPVFNSRKLEIMRLFSEDNPDGKEMFCWFYYSRVKSVNLAGRDLISEFSSKTCPSD